MSAVSFNRGYARDIITIPGSHAGTPTEWQNTTFWPLQRINPNRNVISDCIKQYNPLCHSLYAYTRIYSIRSKLSLHKTIAPIPGINLLMEQ